MNVQIRETKKFKFDNFGKNLRTLAFLNKHDASLALYDNNDYFSAFSRFDIKARSIQDYKGKINDFYSEQSLDWKDWNIDVIIDIFEVINRKMESNTLNFPEVIQLILTTGKEEGHATFCLKNSIILSQEKANYPNRSLELLLTHELFHIYSRYNPKKRKVLYKMLGFIECPKLVYPKELRDFTIINPDTFAYNCYVELNGSKYMPFIYSQKEFGDPIDDDGERASWRGPRKRDLTFFDYITFGLIEIEVKNSKALPILRNNKPIIYDDTLSGYIEKVGKNTDYVIHPEEMLAENFVYMINDRDDYVRNPEILSKLREIMND